MAPNNIEARPSSEDNSRLLKALITLYFAHRSDIVELEGETAYAALGAKYVEELRHAFHDLMEALSVENDLKKEHELLHETKRHLSCLSPTAYQHVTGVLLTEARLKIEEAGILQGSAKELYNQSITFWKEGRKKRSASPDDGVADFKKAIIKAKEAILSISTYTKKDRNGIIIGIIGVFLALIFGIMNLLANN